MATRHACALCLALFLLLGLTLPVTAQGTTVATPASTTFAPPDDTEAPSAGTAPPDAGEGSAPAGASPAAGRRTFLPRGLAGARSVPAATPAPAGASIYWGVAMDGVPWDMNKLAAFEGITGKKVSIVHFWQFWNSRGAMEPFRPALYNAVRSHGSIPMVTWTPERMGGGKDQPEFRLAEIIRGRYDGFIRDWATAAKAWGQPFFLRWAHEMNGNWFPWSEDANGNRRGEYVQAWRRVRDIFKSVGAANASWVWCPNIDFPKSPWPSFSSVYPGDAYVDWTCLDGYNWGPYKNGWLSFAGVYRYSYDAVRGFAGGKPMLLGEISSTENGGSKAAWINDMLGSAMPQAFPGIKAFVWYNYVDEGQDWRVESSPSSIDAFRSKIAAPIYAPNRFGTLGTAPIPAGR